MSKATSPSGPGVDGTEDRSGQRVRSYTLVQLAGVGGFGAVYQARQAGVERDVAVKIIRPQFAGQLAFIRAFEREAQLVARLEHPHIVPLYDYWRDPSGAYLVMRWMQGGTLASALRNAPGPLDVALRRFEQIAAALAFAHGRGVVHRDLKPANVLLDAEGNAVLADFGIASDSGDPSNTGPALFSPGYAAPEQMRAQPVTPQADIYSLGVTLYELLVGARAFSGTTPHELVQQQLAGPPPSLLARRPELPPALDAVIAQALAEEPPRRFADVGAMVAAVRRAVPQTNGVAQPAPVAAPHTPGATMVLALHDEDNPYKGLRAFEEADAADFFGRGALIGRLLDRLRAGAQVEPTVPVATATNPGVSLSAASSRLLAVIGPSGSGKSSVVRAGLLPALRRDGVPGSSRWLFATMTPGTQPLAKLAGALLSVAASTPSGLGATLRQSSDGLRRAAELLLPPDPAVELLLLIDQFEELWTQTVDAAERTHMLRLLADAAQAPGSRLRIILTLRADFYDRPLLDPGLGPLLQRHSEVVLPLSPAEIEQAIVEPARRAGAVVPPELVAAIVADLAEQPGALPLLQYALTDLFEQRVGRSLTLAAYRAQGGTGGALARRAEAIYAALTAAEQELARQLFLRMVSPDEGAGYTRRRVRRGELEGLGDFEPVLARFERARLLTFDRDLQTREPTVEPAHEALLRAWGRLGEWLEAARDDLRTQQRLASGAAEWQAAGRDASYLLTGARLDGLAAWASQTSMQLGAVERAYLSASLQRRGEEAAAEQAAQREREGLLAARLEAERQRSSEREQARMRLQRRALALAGALVVALLALVAAGALGVRAEQQRGLAEQNANLAEAQRATAEVASNLAESQRATAVAASNAAEAQRATAVAASDAADRSAAEARALALVSAAQAALSNGRTDEGLALALAAAQLPEPPPDTYATLAEAADRSRTRARYTSQVFGFDALAFGPDGAPRAIDQNGYLLAWEQGNEEPRYVETGGNSVALTPDGRLALLSSANNGLALYELETGALIASFGPREEVEAVALSPDGRLALSARNGLIRVWDAASGDELRQLAGHGDGLWALEFSSDGTRVFSASFDGTVRVWNSATGDELSRFATPAEAGGDFSPSPDAQTVALTLVNGPVLLFDAASGEQLRRFEGHTTIAVDIAWSADGQTLVSSGDDQTVRRWNVASGVELGRIGLAAPPYGLALDEAGNSALVGLAGGTVLLLDLNTGYGQRVLPIAEEVDTIALSPDGQSVLAAERIGETFSLYDLASGDLLRTFEGHSDGVAMLSFSPDGALALSSGYDNTLRLWDVASGEELRQFAPADGRLTQNIDGFFSPDGSQVIAWALDQTFYVWDSATGAELRRFSGPSQVSFALVPDGSAVLLGGLEGELGLYSLEDGRQLQSFAGHNARVGTVALSPDGSLAASGADDGSLILWDVATGAELRQFVGHSGAVWSLVWSPTGDRLASGSTDRSVRVWDVASGDEVRLFNGHNGSISGLAWGPEGRFLVSTSIDGTVRVWQSENLADLVAWVEQNRAPAPLSCEQRERYQIAPLCDAPR